MKIIPLGKCCKISHDLRNSGTNHQRSVFEWLLSNNFSDIVEITRLICEEKTISITSRDDFEDDFLEDTEIRTRHYIGTYRGILDRRSERFVNDIKSGDFVLFIRDEGENETIKESDVLEFINTTTSLNPNLNFKFILFTKSCVDRINLENVIHLDSYNTPKGLVEFLKKHTPSVQFGPDRKVMIDLSDIEM